MKKFLSLFIFLLSVSLFAVNLLENSSFEIQREANSARPETWTALNEKNLPDTYSFEENDVFSGKRAVKISNKSGKLALYMHSHLGAKLKKLPSGTEMELSAFVRSVKGVPQQEFILNLSKLNASLLLRRRLQKRTAGVKFQSVSKPKILITAHLMYVWQSSATALLFMTVLISDPSAKIRGN